MMIRTLLTAGVLLASTGAAFAQNHVIGMIAPTTGPFATVGLRQLNTVQWWAQDVNGKGGIKGRQVQIIHCNDEANTEKAVTCARDLLGRDSVMLINSSVTGPIRAT